MENRKRLNAGQKSSICLIHVLNRESSREGVFPLLGAETPGVGIYSPVAFGGLS